MSVNDLKIVWCEYLGEAKNGDIRILGNINVGSYFQIYHDGVWGRYCGEGSQLDSVLRMTCSIAGYRNFNAFELDYIDSKEINYGPMMLWNASCSTSATNFNQCNSPGWYIVPQQCKTGNKTLSIQCSGKISISHWLK